MKPTILESPAFDAARFAKLRTLFKTKVRMSPEDFSYFVECKKALDTKTQARAMRQGSLT